MYRHNGLLKTEYFSVLLYRLKHAGIPALYRLSKRKSFGSTISPVRHLAAQAALIAANTIVL